MKYGTWFLDKQETRFYNQWVQEVCKSLSYVFCFVVSVICVFMYTLTGKFMKTGKKWSNQKIKSLNFAESNSHRKTNAHGSFET